MNKSHPLFVLLTIAVHLAAVTTAAQPAPAALPTTNPTATIKQRIGVTDIEVTFSRPGVRGREIFGALVPYGHVWRTGADSATKLTFSTAARVGGAEVPAGTYELFTIPGETAWTVIIHPNKSQWGSYTYDAANDLARIEVKPISLSEKIETFSIGFRDVTAKSAILAIEWDRVRVPVPIEVDVVGLVVPRIEEAMRGEGRKPYFLAAMFYYENNLDLDKAAEWMAAALEQRPGHIGMLHRQALILAKKGDKAGALAAAQASLDGAQAAGVELRDEYTRLNKALIEQLHSR